MCIPAGAVQGFWEHWSYHHLSGKVLAELEKHRIGTLVGWKEDARPGELHVISKCKPGHQLLNTLALSP